MSTSDKDIHNALQGIEVPDAPPNFFDDLQQKLDAEPAPTVVPFGRRRHIARIIGATSVPVAAAAVAALLIVNGGGERGPADPPGTQIAQPPTSQTTETTELKPLLASDVAARMVAALGDVKTFSAAIRTVQHPYSINVNGTDPLPGYTTQGDVRLRNDGAMYVEYSQGPGETHGPEIYAYNAKTSAFRQCAPGVNGKWACSEDTGRITPDLYLDEMLGVNVFLSVVRNLVATDSTAVENVTVDGRPAWRFRATVPLNDGTYYDAASVTVDQETSFPLQVDLYDNDKIYSETTVGNVKVNPPLADADFTVPVTKGGATKPDAHDFGYTRTSLDRLQSQVGYTPLVPSALPAGFELAEVSYAKDHGPGGPEGLNAVNNDVAVVTYRRGLQSVTFTTRRNAGGFEWLDPFAPEYEATITRKNVTLTTGSFAGTKVEVKTTVSDQRLWGAGSKLVLAISGDLTPDEMVAAANSLHQYGKQ